MRRLAALILLLSPGIAFAQTPDWKSVESEALKTLQSYVRINTSNPPGDVTKAADFLQDLLKREGIDAKRYESGPGRSILLARLKGDGTGGKPILLESHGRGSDRSGRDGTDPFGAEISGASLWAAARST
jgi:acetylornithine deacetylase/succinyl-diaminopimelate desuccinylase-like protein